MKLLKVCFAAGLVASIGALAPTIAAARDVSAPNEVTVYFSESNSATDSGASALYSRLRSASRHVCAPVDGRELRQHEAFNACYQQALSNAVLQVNRSAVTTLHARALKAAKAS